MEGKEATLAPKMQPDEFTLEFILPFSKKKVKITAPTWGDRKRAKASSKNIGGDGDDTVEIMLAGCTEIDGKPVESPQDFEKLHVHDFSEILAKFGEWEVDENGKAKNV